MPKIDTLFNAHHSGWGSFKMEGEPSPRWGHYSALVEKKVCVWGGVTKDILKQKSELASSVHSFDPLLEFWDKNKLSGVPPPGLYDGGCASAGHHVYLYDGSHNQSSLHQLDTRSWTWKQLSSAGPMRKVSCGMVAHDSKLVLFGGYGVQSGPTQPGAEFIKSSDFTDGRGWTNEVHTFDLKEGEGVRVGLTSHVTTKFPYETWFCQLPLEQCHIIILYLQHWQYLSVEPLHSKRRTTWNRCSKCNNFTPQ